MYNAVNAIVDFCNDNLSFKREVSCFATPQDGIISITSNNSAGAVEFDFFTIWEYFKKYRPQEVCMIHSHPNGMDHMSSIDRNMVHGWVLALGVPILFIIRTNKHRTEYLCDKSDNKVKIEEVTAEYSPSSYLLINTIYGMSKADNMPEDVIKNITNNIVEAEIKPLWQLI
jgi:proteasome lid subunit RPN8/RPN11